MDLYKIHENTEALSQLSEFQMKLSACHQAVEHEDIMTVRQLVDKQSLLEAVDPMTGMTLIHKAVLLQSKDITKHLTTNFPKAVNITDHVSNAAAAM